MQSVWSALSSGSLQHRFHFVVVRCRAFMCPGSGLHSLWTTYSQMPPDGGGSSGASCWAALMISFWHNLHSQESSSPAGALDGPPVQTVWRGNVCWTKINLRLALSQIYQMGFVLSTPRYGGTCSISRACVQLNLLFYTLNWVAFAAFPHILAVSIFHIFYP